MARRDLAAAAAGRPATIGAPVAAMILGAALPRAAALAGVAAVAALAAVRRPADSPMIWTTTSRSRARSVLSESKPALQAVGLPRLPGRQLFPPALKTLQGVFPVRRPLRQRRLAKVIDR